MTNEQQQVIDAIRAAIQRRLDESDADALCEPAHGRGLSEALEVLAEVEAELRRKGLSRT